MCASSCNFLHGCDAHQSYVQSSAVQTSQGSFVSPCVDANKFPLAAVSVKICCYPSKDPSTLQAAHKQNWVFFRASVVECDSDFLSHTHQSLTNVSRWLMFMSDFGIRFFLLLSSAGCKYICSVSWCGLAHRGTFVQEQRRRLWGKFDRGCPLLPVSARPSPHHSCCSIQVSFLS